MADDRVPNRSALAGRRILITRPEHQAQGLVEGIQERGGDPFLFPTLVITPPPDLRVWEQVANDLEGFDWLIFVSANAVAGFAEQLDAYGLAWPKRPGCAAIGRKSAQALSARVDCPVVVPADYRSEGLLALPEMAAKQVAGQRILLVRGQRGRELLPKALEERGAEVERVAVYARRLPETDPTPLTKALVTGRLDAAVFTSPDTFRNLLQLLSPRGCQALDRIPLIVISPVTADAVAEAGYSAPIVAPEVSEEGLVQALEERIAPTLKK